MTETLAGWCEAPKGNAKNLSDRSLGGGSFFYELTTTPGDLRL
jgi:hypothetical protein